MNSMMGYSGPAGASSRGNSSGGFREKIPKGYSAGSLQQFDPNQLRLYESLFSHLGPDSYLARLAGGDESFFEQMERPAMRQFQEQIGGLASRFSGAGLGARRGSGFQNATTQATSDFAMNLASQRQALQKQAIFDLMGLSQSLLGQRPYERTLTEKPKSFLESAGTSFAGGFGEAFGKAIVPKIPGLG